MQSNSKEAAAGCKGTHASKNASLATKRTQVSIGVLVSDIITGVADSNPRYFVDLRQANVSRGKRSNGDRYIEIQDRNNEIVQVAFEDPDEFKKWGIVFVESIKSDEVLRQS